MKRSLVLVLSVALVITFVGVACYKTTGGGWFWNYDIENGSKITFGMSAIPVGEPYDCEPGMGGNEACSQDAKGTFNLVDHGMQTKVSGNFDGTVQYTDCPSLSTMCVTRGEFTGTCSVRSASGREYGCKLIVSANDYGEPGIDAGDFIYASCDCNLTDEEIDYEYYGSLRGGNLQVHFKEKE